MSRTVHVRPNIGGHCPATSLGGVAAATVTVTASEEVANGVGVAIVVAVTVVLRVSTIGTLFSFTSDKILKSFSLGLSFFRHFYTVSCKNIGGVVIFRKFCLTKSLFIYVKIRRFALIIKSCVDPQINSICFLAHYIIHTWIYKLKQILCKIHDLLPCTLHYTYVYTYVYTN